MQTNPFTWILNQIRLGYNKVATLVQGKARFPSVDPVNVQSNWAMAWGSKIIGQRMQTNQQARLSDIIFAGGTGADLPDTKSTDDMFVDYTRVKAYNDFDFSATTKIGQGTDIQYGTWRYQANGDDTFSMIMETLEETVIKEYSRGRGGQIVLVNLFVIPRTIP